MTSHFLQVVEMAKGAAKARDAKPKEAGAKAAKPGEGEKRNTSLRLDNKTLKALKLRAIEEDTSVQRIVETLIEDYLRKGKKKAK